MLYRFPELVESFLFELREKLWHEIWKGNHGHAFQSLRRNMWALCAKACVVQEDLDKADADLHVKKKRKIEDDEDWMVRVKEIEIEILSLKRIKKTKEFAKWFFDESRAAILDVKLDQLLGHTQNFGELKVRVDDVKREPLSTKMLVGKEFEDKLKCIMRILQGNNVASIAIHGMGGVGKTELAKHIHNQLLEKSQACVVWITVSQEFTILRLQEEIAKGIGFDLSDECNEDERRLRLHMELSKRSNVILILDDVWENIDLKKLKITLSTNGSNFLITTRSLFVCNRIRCEDIIELKPLNSSESWNLFKETLGKPMDLTTQVQEIAKSMIEECEGLPLGIISLVRRMKGETGVSKWTSALSELKECVRGQRDLDGDVFKVLKYSFDLLDSEGKSNQYSSLQLCFLYCCLLTEPGVINVDELTKKFLQEEFLLGNITDERKYVLEKGHTMLYKLANLGLLERVGIDNVKMHNLVRAMALQISKSKLHWHRSSKKNSIEEEWDEDVEKMSLSYNGITEIPSDMSPNCPKLSTLLLNGNPLQFIPESFFQHLEALCVVDLSRTNIKKLPDTLSILKRLKALTLTECRKLVHVPCIGKIKELKELDLTLTAIDELPEGMEELVNLRFLSLEKAYQLEMLPRGLLSKLQSLECLYLPYHIHVRGEELAPLEHLEEFHGRLKDGWDFFHMIRRKNFLRYSIEACPGFQKSKLDEFRGHNQLFLSNFDFKKAGDEDAAALAKGNIYHLKLHAYQGRSTCLYEDISQICNNSYIYSLEIDRCEEIECLLRKLQLADPEAKSDSVLASASVSRPIPRGHYFYSCLKCLEIFRCNKITCLGLLASNLQLLERITVAYCKEVVDIMEDYEDKRAAPNLSLPRLKCVFLEDLPKLKGICNATTVCKSLEVLSFWGCPMLKKLPLVIGPLSNGSSRSTLKSICISKDEMEWWKSLELVHPNGHSLLDPFLKL